MDEDEIIALFSEESMLKTSRQLYKFIKLLRPDAIVACHIYPKFNPNPDYGSKFRVDYCGQSISWFFKPFWDIDEVRRNARRMKSMENTQLNRFMPFVACFGQDDSSYLKKSPERLGEEIKIALEYGNGSMMFAPLGVLYEHKDLYKTVRSLLKQ